MDQDKFLKDVSKHQMHIIRDDGVNRHIRFKKPDSINMYFDLITWPGHLCYTGDMGTYVFSRVEDMFTFFRGSAPKSEGEAIKINPDYWSEKLLAVDKTSGFREWNRKEFENSIKKDFEQWINSGFDKRQQSELREKFLKEVLEPLEDLGEVQAYQSVLEFSYGNEHPFQDWFEVDTKTFTFRFLWCCRALVWGIRQYDAVKNISA